MSENSKIEWCHHVKDKIHWLIAGGESGPKARPTRPDWAKSLRDQCLAAKVPFFWKQWGQWGPVDGDLRQFDRITMENGRGWVMRKYKSKHTAGRLLDGREWNEFPVASGTKC